MLDIPESLPPAISWRRWIGEPVKVAVLPTSAFVTNKRGYPTLPKSHQALLTTFFSHGIQV